MKRVAAVLCLLLLVWTAGDAAPQNKAAGNRNVGAPSAGFPRTVRVRLWALHPPRELTLRAKDGNAHLQLCAACANDQLTNVAVRALGSRLQLGGVKKTSALLRVTGAFTMSAQGAAPVRADFPVEVRAAAGHLLITATMPMEEYVAGVLAGETGNFKSDEALKAMAVSARTYAMHFGSRHALEGFDFCDTTHCQDLRLSGIDARLRGIADATAGEVLWYNGAPAATYYHANCGGTTEDGRFFLGDDHEQAPFLRQHSDEYCVRNGSLQWRTEVTSRELQGALRSDGVRVPGTLRSVAVAQRTPSGRVELLRLSGTGSTVVAAQTFRYAVGRHIGWERLKSNWYDVSTSGDRIEFHGRGSGHGVGLCQVGAEVMGEEGHSYREILSYYYPGTKLGGSAQGIAWQQLSNEELQLLTTRPDEDSQLLPVATRVLRDAQSATGLTFKATPRIKVFPTVAMFRDTTGEPGWVAATTRGRTIQLQPAEVLRGAGTLESTLRHELLHILIESYAGASTPVWFREGLVLYLSEPKSAAQDEEFKDGAKLESALRNPASEADLRRAYAAAHARVAELVRKYGERVVIGWVGQGLPREVANR